MKREKFNLRLRNNKWDASLRWHDAPAPWVLCVKNFLLIVVEQSYKNTVMPAKGGIPFIVSLFVYILLTQALNYI